MRKKGIRKNKNISKHLKTSKKKIYKTKLNPKFPLWDKTESVKTNFQNFGIALNINDVINQATNQKLGDQLFHKIKGKQLKQQQEQQQDQDDNDNQMETTKIQIEETVPLDYLKKIFQGQTLKEEDFIKKKRKNNLDEDWAIQAIVKKYGTDFKKAYMDHKVNKFMWNKNQIAKKYQSYMEKMKEEEWEDEEEQQNN